MLFGEFRTWSREESNKIAVISWILLSYFELMMENITFFGNAYFCQLPFLWLHLSDIPKTITSACCMKFEAIFGVWRSSAKGSEPKKMYFALLFFDFVEVFTCTFSPIQLLFKHIHPSLILTYFLSTSLPLSVWAWQMDDPIIRIYVIA